DASTQALTKALVRELNRRLEDEDLYIEYNKERPVTVSPPAKLKGDLRCFNRGLLRKAFQGEIKSASEFAIREMFKKIFFYCIYNSYDFQLAGYSHELALCDLTKVQEPETGLTAILKELTGALRGGVEEPEVRDLILLAHWDAQSYWQESYIDMYDFCF